MSHETRRTPADVVTRPIQVRSVEERTVEGVIVPWGETIPLGRRRHERWERGSVDTTRPDEVRFAYEHAEVIGRALELRDTDEGLVGTFRVARTTRGDDVLELAREGLVGLSAGFAPEQTRPDGNVEVITRARLGEVSAVAFPAYAGSTVTAVRNLNTPGGEPMSSTDAGPADEPVTDTTPDTPAPAVDVDGIVNRAVTAAVSEVRSLVTRPTPRADVVERREPWQALAVRALRDVANPDTPYRTRALADVVGDLGTGDASGLLDDEYRAELIGYLDARRPNIAAAGTVEFPSSGYGITYPKKTQSTLVAKRGTGEKTEAPSRALQVTPVTFPMEWFAGGVDISLELIWQSDPSVLEVVVNDMLDQYAIVTEEEFAGDAALNATLSGAALDFTDWGTFSPAIQAASRSIAAATGRPGNLVSMTGADWDSFVSVVLPTAPATLNNGERPDLTDEAVTLAGVTFFHGPRNTDTLQYNSKALGIAERAPAQVSSDNVALMGRDVGLLGATIVCPFYPAGIVRHAAV